MLKSQSKTNILERGQGKKLKNGSDFWLGFSKKRNLMVAQYNQLRSSGEIIITSIFQFFFYSFSIAVICFIDIQKGGKKEKKKDCRLSNEKRKKKKEEKLDRRRWIRQVWLGLSPGKLEKIQIKALGNFSFDHLGKKSSLPSPSLYCLAPKKKTSKKKKKEYISGSDENKLSERAL